MLVGKQIRTERIIDRNTKRMIVVPLDHGVSVGPVDGLIDMPATVNAIAEGGANAVLMHKGLVRCGHRHGGRDIGLIVHLSASTDFSPAPNSKTVVGTVEEALKTGADGISMHVNIGDESEREMLADMGRLTRDAADWGMPALAMVYARGPKVRDGFDPKVVAHCARVGMELGADIVKVPYTGDPESFSRVVDSCCIPVVIAGGPKLDSDRAILQMAHDAVAAGAAGLSVGRNIFQHPDPRALVSALHGVVHEDLPVDEAEARLNSLMKQQG